MCSAVAARPRWRGAFHDDIEVVGYVETAPGAFKRVVSLAGRATEVPPLVFPPQAVPEAQQLTRLSRALVDGGVADALVVTLTRSPSSTWLLALLGEIYSPFEICFNAGLVPVFVTPHGRTAQNVDQSPLGK